jgi:hypothetical protein
MEYICVEQNAWARCLSLANFVFCRYGIVDRPAALVDRHVFDWEEGPMADFSFCRLL